MGEKAYMYACWAQSSERVTSLFHSHGIISPPPVWTDHFVASLVCGTKYDCQVGRQGRIRLEVCSPIAVPQLSSERAVDRLLRKKRGWEGDAEMGLSSVERIHPHQ